LFPENAAAEHPEDARFRLAMASAGIGMAIVSLDGTFLNVNPALCEMLGMSHEALLACTVREITHAEDVGRTEEYLADLREGRRDTLEVEKRYRRGDGRVLWGQLNVGVMRDAEGKPLDFIVQLRDITAQRATNEELERRVQARTAELQALNKHLELFAFGISHDLRAPLRTIDSFAAILEQQHAAQLDDPARQHLQRIRRAAAAMAQLIDRLLELSRANRSELRQEPVDLSLLAEWVGAELQEGEPGRTAVIHVQPGLAAIGDERLLKVLLGQLMENAWKFSRGREQVRIEVGGHRDAAGLQLWVRDWGSGFGIEYADKVFEPFKRAHAPEQGGGNGLGLAIARRIVERHGGTIGAESMPGAGTTIRIILPAAAGRSHAPRDA
jgi:PAS domain S-box-containing protein